MNTLRMNSLLLSSFSRSQELEWEKFRFVAFHNYVSVVDYGKQPWKRIYKRPSDLMELDLDGEITNVRREVSPERMSNALNIIKNNNKFKEWQSKG